MADQKALPAAATLEDKVKERVKGFMLDALGDEEIEKLVQESMKKFIYGYSETEGTGYHKWEKQVPGQLQPLIQKAVDDYLKARVATSLKEQLGAILDAKFGDTDVSDAARKLISELGPVLLEGTIKGFATQLLPAIAQTILYQIQNSQSLNAIPVAPRSF